jgi:hypothetical protein
MLDRRGRGVSGDAPEYRLEREYEDVAAVVDAVAAVSGNGWMCTGIRMAASSPSAPQP